MDRLRQKLQIYVSLLNMENIYRYGKYINVENMIIKWECKKWD